MYSNPRQMWICIADHVSRTDAGGTKADPDRSPARHPHRPRGHRQHRPLADASKAHERDPSTATSGPETTTASSALTAAIPTPPTCTPRRAKISATAATIPDPNPQRLKQHTTGRYGTAPGPEPPSPIDHPSGRESTARLGLGDRAGHMRATLYGAGSRRCTLLTGLSGTAWTPAPSITRRGLHSRHRRFVDSGRRRCIRIVIRCKERTLTCCWLRVHRTRSPEALIGTRAVAVVRTTGSASPTHGD
jgi:hypothetical protein